MKVYVVRHGEVIYNRLKQYFNEDIDLNETGIKQAEELSAKIKDLEYDVIIASPFIRTKHTAEIINKKEKEIIFDERLKERDAGSLAGECYTIVNREEFWNYYSKEKYGTAETIESLFTRVFKLIDELKEKEYDNILIVTHSGVSKAFSAYFEGIQDGKFLNRGLNNCEIKEYRLENENGK